MEEAVASFEQRRAFQRAIALNLRVTHGRNDQWASNPESVQEEFQGHYKAPDPGTVRSVLRVQLRHGSRQSTSLFAWKDVA